MTAALVTNAKLGILGASLLTGLCGFVYLWIAPGEPGAGVQGSALGVGGRGDGARGAKKGAVWRPLLRRGCRAGERRLTQLPPGWLVVFLACGLHHLSSACFGSLWSPVA